MKNDIYMFVCESNLMTVYVRLKMTSLMLKANSNSNKCQAIIMRADAHPQDVAYAHETLLLLGLK